jgi:hypothetical protein
MKLAKAVFTPVILILFVPLLAAQQDTLNPMCKLLNLNSNWGFGAGMRYTFLDFTDMNNALEEAGLPGLESPVACLDLAVRTSCSWKRFIVESGFKYSFGSSESQNLENRQSVTFQDYALQSRLMLDVFRRNNYSKVYPYMGLGVSYQVLKTHTEQSLDFGNISENVLSGNDLRFTYIPFSFEAGLSVEQGFKMFGKQIFLGFRSGYAFRFFQTRWSLDQNYAVDLPKPAASAPFVALILRVKSSPKKPCPYTMAQSAR